MGDSVYGSHFKTKASSLGVKSRAALEALDRQALHAYLLALEHPRTGEILEWTSELASRFGGLLQSAIWPCQNDADAYKKVSSFQHAYSGPTGT